MDFERNAFFDEDDDPYGDDIERYCHWCGGEGFVSGDELGDPLWYDESEFYTCTSCGGTGNAKDMTIW